MDLINPVAIRDRTKALELGFETPGGSTSPSGALQSAAMISWMNACAGLGVASTNSTASAAATTIPDTVRRHQLRMDKPPPVLPGSVRRGLPYANSREAS